MGTVVLVLRVALAVVLVVAAVGKLLDRSGSRLALRGFGVPTRVASVGATWLPLVELAIAAALVLRPSAVWGAVAAAVLLVTFVAGIVNVLAKGLKPGCHCFGIFHSEPAGPRAVARNGALLTMAVVAAVAGPGPSISTWSSARSAAQLAAIGLGLLAAALAVIVWRFWRETVRLTTSLAEKEAVLDALPPGLPVGALAPEFHLTDARTGGTLTLKQLRARGKPVLLVFIGLGCGPSDKILPDLARWQRTLADRLTLAIVSRGGPEHHEYELRVLGMDHVGLQSEFETIHSYRVQGTPSAVLVSPDGRIAAPVAQAPPAIEALVRVTLRDGMATSRRTLRPVVPV